MTTPGVVLVHGLWHGAWCWDAVHRRLAAADVPSVAPELPLTSLADDVAAVCAALDEFARPTVLVGHSYGGAVVTAAGVHPNVRRLVYLAAFQLDEGESVNRAMPDRAIPPTRLSDALEVTESQVALRADLAADVMYNGVPHEVTDAAIARLRPVARGLFRETPQAIAWRTVPSTYVVCSKDLTVAPDLERAMAERATSRVEWPCGHMAMAERPELVADLLVHEVRELRRTER
jgi:pimeloyl-ACP methyl ester carboxylesterase